MTLNQQNFSNFFEALAYAVSEVRKYNTNELTFGTDEMNLKTDDGFINIWFHAHFGSTLYRVQFDSSSIRTYRWGYRDCHWVAYDWMTEE